MPLFALTLNAYHCQCVFVPVVIKLRVLNAVSMKPTTCITILLL